MRKVKISRTMMKKMVNRIVDHFNPEKIILFGSHARGDAGPDSDVDLLIVMPVEGSKREKQLEVRAILDDIPIPKDVIVTRPEDFEWRKEIVGTIERPADQEGKILYARKRKGVVSRPGVVEESRKRSKKRYPYT